MQHAVQSNVSQPALPLRIGVIGCGHWGPNHIRVFSQMKGVVVTAVADRDETRLGTVCEMFAQVRGYADYEQMLEGPVDAVVVATPTKTHFEVVARALHAG